MNKTKILSIAVTAIMSISSLAFSQVKVGDNPSIIDASAVMELESTNKGLLLPRVTLTGKNDAVTILNPATGLTVYHNGNAVLAAGLCTNIGSPSNPVWIRAAETEFSDENGSKVYKTKFVGRNESPYSKPTLKIAELNLEIRFAIISGVNRLQYRLINQPLANVLIRSSGHYHGASHNHSNATFSFTPANYGTWQNVDGSWSDWWSYLYYISSNEKPNVSINFYGLCNYGNGEQYVLAAELF